MKQYKSILLVLFLILGCQSEIEQNDNTNKNAIPLSFYAGIEMPTDSSLTKTILDGSPIDEFRNLLWEYQDEVYVTNGLQSSKFINTSQGTSKVALLEGELEEGTNYFAAYPYRMVTSSSMSSFTIDLPSEQTYCKDGIESETFPMVAQCKDGVFDFKNICGILVVQLLGEQSISAITFSGKDAADNYISVAGNGAVSLDYFDVPALVMNNSSEKSVSITSSVGVQLSSTIPTSFHIVLPPVEYSSFELVIKATDGSVMKIKSSKSLNIKRSSRTTAKFLNYTGIIVDLNEMGETANCYIISEPGAYKFKAVKGNRNESVGSVASVDVLWESVGTTEIPNVGDLIKNVSYSDEYICFNTNSQFQKGNAVIAAKNSDGVILWSWHIWLTDQPAEQLYYNNAGTMMDRNLGAFSAQPGSVGSKGLLYQWGRKDPFIREDFYNPYGEEHSTGTWTPKTDIGSIDFTIQNPMSWIGTSYDHGHEFHYSMYYSDNTLWGREKTIYDPCPVGWRVPDGGEDSIWAAALGSSEDMTNNSLYDEINHGFDFSGIFGDGTIWYPAAGHNSDGTLSSPMDMSRGDYWSVTPSSGIMSSYSLFFSERFSERSVCPSSFSMPRYSAQSIRCQKDIDMSNNDETTFVDLNETREAANCYIVSEAGNYKFKAVKGNSNDPVGAASRVAVLWESFGTNISPQIGELIHTVSLENDYIHFSTSKSFKEGNALIAALDSMDEVIWSWHIWLTDSPEERSYNNGADITMNRNLGATSATRGDATANGLLYQWGRKDPFLGSSSNSISVPALSTGDWKTMESSWEVGTISYATKNPLTFICANNHNHDWYYESSSTTDFTRWGEEKTLYDPCPSGWRVPLGGKDNLWKAKDIFTDTANYCIGVATDSGYDWYPCAGSYSARSGELVNTGKCGIIWTSTPSKLWGYAFYGFYFNINGTFYNEYSYGYGADAEAIRCIRE